MRFLINDFDNTRDEYTLIFSKYGYEENELIFCKSFEETREFIANYLDNKKLHIDLIITNDSRDNNYDELKSSELCFFKNTITNSFSSRNFRISSIPIILYSKDETREHFLSSDFSSVVQKKTLGFHDFFIAECENAVKQWRKEVYSDLEELEVRMDQLPGFAMSDFFIKYYLNRISANAEAYFVNRTKVVSLEFIKCPAELHYDWITLRETNMEKAILDYIDTYKNHLKYDRKNNERTILHQFFKKNKIILLRDAYADMKYEENLFEINAKNSEECDFILKTEYPDFLKTTFFEVKKEDVKFYVKKNTKRPQISSEFLSHLEQVWGYKKFALNPAHEIELQKKLEYSTDHYDFMLLAGRLEEKEEMREKFEEDIHRMFNGVQVITYEELEDINVNYLEKFNRLKI